MVAILTLVATARAEPFLDYEAAPSCPGAERFSDEVAARLGRMVFTAEGEERVEVRIVDGLRVQGTLSVPGGGKGVDGEDCQQVFDSLVASAAVLLDVSLTATPAPTSQAPNEDLLLRDTAPYGMEPAPDWVVRYPSGSALETEAFLRITEAPELLDFRRRVRGRNMRAALVGGAGSVLFTVGLAVLPSTLILASIPDSGVSPGVAAATGSGTIVGGLLVGAAIPPLLRSSKERRDPSRYLTAERADDLIETHNQMLVR